MNYLLLIFIINAIWPNQQSTQVTVGGAIADPAAASEPDVRFSPHPAPEHSGHCHWHSPNRYRRGPLSK
jgi:hypothetical protein